MTNSNVTVSNNKNYNKEVWLQPHPRKEGWVLEHYNDWETGQTKVREIPESEPGCWDYGEKPKLFMGPPDPDDDLPF